MPLTPTPCYHCHAAPHVPGSVFCADCKPEPGALPALIQEPTSESKQSNAPSFLTRLLAPRRHAANVTKRMRSIEDELKDCQQANLALRRKCQDLKAQRDSAVRLLDAALGEKHALEDEITRLRLDLMQAEHDHEKQREAALDAQATQQEEFRAMAIAKVNAEGRALIAGAQLADLRAQYQEGATE